MRIKKGLVLHTQSGDWEGLYIDGKLITEGEGLEDINEWLIIAERYKISGVIYKELEDIDDNEVYNIGSMPTTLEGFKREYGGEELEPVQGDIYEDADGSRYELVRTYNEVGYLFKALGETIYTADDNGNIPFAGFPKNFTKVEK